MHEMFIFEIKKIIDYLYFSCTCSLVQEVQVEQISNSKPLRYIQRLQGFLTVVMATIFSTARLYGHNGCSSNSNNSTISIQTF